MIGELENERDFLREQILGKAKGQDVGQYNYVSCCVQYLLHTSKLWAFLFISPYGCWVLLALANSIRYDQHCLNVTLLCLCFCKTCQITLGMIWIFQVKWALELQLCILLAFNSYDEYNDWLQHCKCLVFHSIILLFSIKKYFNNNTAIFYMGYNILLFWYLNAFTATHLWKEGTFCYFYHSHCETLTCLSERIGIWSHKINTMKQCYPTCDRSLCKPSDRVKKKSPM